MKIGTQIDKLYKIKESIDEASLALSKTNEAKTLARHNKRYKELEAEIMSTFPRNELDGGIGKVAIASINTLTVGQVIDWNQVYKFIKRTNGFDLLNRAFNNKAYRERLDAGKQVPGVKTAHIHKLSLRKRPQK